MDRLVLLNCYKKSAWVGGAGNVMTRQIQRIYSADRYLLFKTRRSNRVTHCEESSQTSPVCQIPVTFANVESTYVVSYDT